ncbi:hypothetical protein GCM10023257_18240 [Streptomyces hyderabadensis]|uniref:Replication initiation protein n=1 Tax=Streptomyces hyderabadensis TaxID=598549 RepID=A0ABP9HWZ3_9ACTN
MNVPPPLPPAVAALLDRAARPDFPDWRRTVIRLGGCTNPVHLVGSAVLVDTATGEALTDVDGSDPNGRRLLTACGNRRASACPACSRVYQADTYQLVRAGLVGGKAVPETVSEHPRVFATLTAPGFGPVHTRREQSGRVRPCRPRRDAKNCPHGVPLGCSERHAPDDPRLGEPLCPRCYDYGGAVLWQSCAGLLWHRFGIELRREIARKAGLSRTELADVARLSYAKVAEYQRRGLVHFHAVVRLDGPDGPDSHRPPGQAPPCSPMPSPRPSHGSVCRRLARRSSGRACCASALRSTYARSPPHLQGSGLRRARWPGTSPSTPPRAPRRPARSTDVSGRPGKWSSCRCGRTCCA